MSQDLNLRCDLYLQSARLMLVANAGGFVLCSLPAGALRCLIYTPESLYLLGFGRLAQR